MCHLCVHMRDLYPYQLIRSIKYTQFDYLHVSLSQTVQEFELDQVCHYMLV